ncbi:hypothetical protein [Eubacterium sp.]
MSSSYITDSEGNIVYPKTLAKRVNKGGSTLEEYLNDVEDATLIKPTVSGTDMVLTDSSDMNIQELHIYGKTEQNITKGIQLLNLLNSKGGTGDGVTYTPNGDGSFKRTGTATGQSGNIWLIGGYYYLDWEERTPIITLEVGKSYYIKDCAIYQGSTNIASGSGYVINVTREKYPEGIKITGIRNTGFTLNKTYNDVIYPIVAESSTAVEWEEYTGGQASPNPDYPQEMVGVENPTISVVGKNLYSFSMNGAPKETTRNGIKYIKNQDGSLKIKGTATAVSKYEVITLDKSPQIFKNSTIGEKFTFKIFGLPETCYWEMSYTGKIYGEKSRTFVNSENYASKKYTMIVVPEGVTVDTTIYPMLVLGDSILEYEPYKEIQTTQLTCELNGIDDVRDELIVRADGTGQLIQRLLKEEINENSNLIKWYATNNAYGFGTSDIKWLFRENRVNIKSNKLPCITKEVGNSGTYDTNGIFISQSGGINFKILKKYINEYSVEALKTYLKDNPIEVVGLLAEPIITELSYEDVQKILNLKTYKQYSTIWNDQNADMQITYVADAKSYIDNKFTELETQYAGGLLITNNLIDNSNMLNNTALTISDKISTSSNSTYKTYLNIPVQAGESYYIGKSHRNSCVVDSIENKKVLQSNMVNQTDSYIFNVNYDGFLCVCFYTTEQNPKIALLTREKTES